MRFKSLAAAAIGIVVALGLTSCDEEEISALAGLAPSDALFYVEASIRPEGESAEAIEAIAARFPGGEDLGRTIESGIDQSLAEDSDGGGPLTYREDIEPWLGERAALFVREVAEFEQEAAPPMIVEVTDVDAAQTFIDSAAEADESEETQEEYEGVSYYLDDEGAAVGMVDDHLVVAGEEEGFTGVVDAARGEESDLAESSRFSYDVGGSDGQENLAFAFLEIGPIVEQAIAAAPSVVSADQVRELAAERGFDLDEPWLFSVDAESDAASFDVSVPVSSTTEEPEEATDLLAGMPADSILAARCDFCAAGLLESLKLGIEATSPSTADAEDPVDEVERAFGIDFDELEQAFGTSAVFLRGSNPAELEAGAKVDVLDAQVAQDALEAARSILETSAPSATTIGELPPIAGATEGFSVATPELLKPVVVALAPERLIAAVGEEAARDALEPSQTLDTSGKIAEADERIGSDYEPTLYGDIGAIIELVATFTGADADLAAAAPYLDPLGLVLAGTRDEDDRRITRLVVTFD